MEMFNSLHENIKSAPNCPTFLLLFGHDFDLLLYKVVTYSYEVTTEDLRTSDSNTTLE